MSGRGHRAKSCEEKRRYPTSREAEATAQYQREESGETDLGRDFEELARAHRVEGRVEGTAAVRAAAGPPR